MTATHKFQTTTVSFDLTSSARLSPIWNSRNSPRLRRTPGAEEELVAASQVSFQRVTAADGVVHDQPFRERAPVVAARRADREDLRAPPHQHDGRALDGAQGNSVGERIPPHCRA
jgi:hypothetical protein